MMIKEKMLPIATSSWATELPTSGYVTKTNDYLSGRWVTVGGGDTEFTKKSVARVMLGGAGASKVQAARFHVLFSENHAE